jgi:hypothetical protein
MDWAPAASYDNIRITAELSSDTVLLGESAGRFGTINQTGGSVLLTTTLRSGAGPADYNLGGGLLKAAEVRGAAANTPFAGTFDWTGGTLSVGTFICNLTQGGGTLMVGNSPGLTTVTGNYSLSSGDLDIELDGLTAQTEYDVLAVTGDVSLAGALALSLGFPPAVGNSFTIIDNQGANPVSGMFTQGSSISAGGYLFSINYAGGRTRRAYRRPGRCGIAMASWLPSACSGCSAVADRLIVDNNCE